ncbi:MAG TPA: hypothetical protein VI039_04440 [Solirubrobacterales bacterium]
MSSIKSTIARKAVKTTAKHSARGAAAKAKRNPMRALTLLGIGVAVGFVAGRVLCSAGRGTQPS